MLPSHQAVGKESGLTYCVERFNNTDRGRIVRLVHTIPALSKKLQNHTGSLRYSVHHHNLSFDV